MKLPPYGKPLHQLLLSNKKPDNNVYCYCGDKAWDLGKSSSICRPTRTLVLPPTHFARSYIWPVAGCEILLIETSEVMDYYIESIVQSLFDYDANSVVLLSFNLLITSYKKDF
jgi:hypothetical protein